jgi:hypothetical protein
VNKFAWLLLVFPIYCSAEFSITTSFTKTRPETNDFHSSNGFSISTQWDQGHNIFTAYYIDGEAQTLSGFDAYNRWQARHVQFHEGHIFDRTITLEWARRLPKGFVAGATIDAIHVKQHSYGYSGHRGLENTATHLGYKNNYWEYGLGALVGYEINYGNLYFRLDVGYIDHYTNDIRLHGLWVYKINETLSFVIDLKDYEKLDYTQYDVGIRYRFR